MSRRGLAWTGLVTLGGGVVGAAVNLVLAVLVGQGLGASGAGTFFTMMAVFAIAANVLELGADTGLVRHHAAAVATGRHGELTALGRVALGPPVVVGVLAATALWLGAPLLAPVLDSADPASAERTLRTIAPFVVLAALSMVALGGVRGLGGVASFTLVQNIGLPLSRVLLVGGVVVLGLGTQAAIGAWLAPLPVVAAVALALLVRMTRRARRDADGSVVPRAGRELAGDFWRFSSTRGVAAAVEICLEWVDVLIVAALASPTDAGIYAVVTRAARAGEIVQQAARIAVGPQVSAALAREDTAEARRLYSTVTSAMVLLAWPFFALLAVFSTGVLSVFGEGFGSGATALTVLAVAMGLATGAGILQTVLLMGGKSWWQLADKSAALGCNVVLNLLLVPVLGITGAAIAWAATIALDTALAAFQVHRSMGVSPSLRTLAADALLPLAVFAVGGLVVRLVVGPGLLGLGAALVLGVPVYAVLLWRRHGALLRGLLRRRGDRRPVSAGV